MDRDDFLTKKRLPIRKGQKWTLSEPWHARDLPQNIEILEVKELPTGIEGIKAYKCKIRQFDPKGKPSYRSPWKYFSNRTKDIDITEFMFAGDILTYYEQI